MHLPTHERGAWWLGAAVASLAVFTGCESTDTPSEACVDWKSDVQPAMAESCRSCHDATTPSGSYRVDSYLDAIGPGSDGAANAVLGDEGSRLITRLAEAGEGDPHAGHGEILALVTRWIVQCRVAWSLSSPHEAGILNPADQAQFHRRRVEDALYDLSACGDCHGADLKGGSGGDCTRCHDDPMQSCNACHPNPASGAHRDHLQTSLSDAVDCAMCHPMPGSGLLSPGHVLTASGEIDPLPAEVELTGMSSQGVTGAGFDASAGTCATYCHGDAFTDANRDVTPMPWLNGAGSSGCTSCHGMPPSSHSIVEACNNCHGSTVDVAGNIIFNDGSTTHMDGDVDL